MYIFVLLEWTTNGLGQNVGYFSFIQKWALNHPTVNKSINAFATFKFNLIFSFIHQSESQSLSPAIYSHYLLVRACIADTS